MHGAGAALVTPFADDGEVNLAALDELVGELEARGVDFLVPAGSTGEAPLLTDEEQAAVIAQVAEAATVPVIAGTGQAGLAATEAMTAEAAAAGADAALVVTPYYYAHGQDALVEYYRELADRADVPIYAYSIPSKTGVALEPASAAAVADHPNVAGMKDSTGDLERLHRELALTADADFDVLVGHGGLLAEALGIGAAGGITALANVAPERVSEVYDRFESGDVEGARALNAELVELNHAVTKRHGVAGLKAAMRFRGLPAGGVRKPHRPVGPEAAAELERLVGAAGP